MKYMFIWVFNSVIYQKLYLKYMVFHNLFTWLYHVIGYSKENSTDNKIVLKLHVQSHNIIMYNNFEFVRHTGKWRPYFKNSKASREMYKEINGSTLYKVGCQVYNEKS